MDTMTPKKENRSIVMKMPVAEAFISLAAAFVNQAAEGLGLDGEGADALSLATEEVIAYLARMAQAEQDVEICCSAGSCFIETKISLPVRELQLHAFNMTARVNADDDAGLDQMGLLIASRMTDRFHITRSAGQRLVLTLIKELPYPEIKRDTTSLAPIKLSQYTLQAADAAHIKWFLRLVTQCYPDALFPLDFRYPGKVVDMAAGGDYHIVAAKGPAGELGGGIAWRWEGRKTVELFGPYIFQEHGDPQMARDLMDRCIGHVARTSALALINRMPTPDLPEGYLEALEPKQNDISGDDSRPARARFRMMVEETGEVVWAHPDVVDFLQSEYRRLVFPRDIQTAGSDGEADEPFSVLSAEIDRRLAVATLRPIWPGADNAKNMAAHVELLRREAMATLLFEMDLGRPWQAGFTPGLIALGFYPRMILPHAGSADLLIFQLRTDA